jgi:hypothetical protein
VPVGGPDTDCNANEVADACDIVSGAVTDANSNGIPDTCEGPVPVLSNGGSIAVVLLLVIGIVVMARRGHVMRP